MKEDLEDLKDELEDFKEGIEERYEDLGGDLKKEYLEKDLDFNQDFYKI